MTRVLLALRSALFYLGYVSATVLLSGLFILVFPLISHRNSHRIAALWSRTILGWLRICCGVSYEIIGLENIKPSPAVYLSNHQSNWETLLFYRLIYPLSPILKKELLNIPFWGWALRLTKPIAIDRSKPREAGRSLLTQGVQRLGEGQSVIVFPEGTRSPPGYIKRFTRSGATLAAAASVPIVPIAHNAGYVWPPRSFIKYPGKVTVQIGHPIDVDDHSVKIISGQVEAWVRNHMVVRN